MLKITDYLAQTVSITSRTNPLIVSLSKLDDAKFRRSEGLFLAEKMKQINPRVNIIFVTVCSESEHAKTVMQLKPSGYLTKEATNTQILEELQNLRYPVA